MPSFARLLPTNREERDERHVVHEPEARGDVDPQGARAVSRGRGMLRGYAGTASTSGAATGTWEPITNT